MTVRVALRSLLTRPVRSAVLSGGFGFGIAVMAALLGVGEVILEQARSPDLRGGGDVVLFGLSGEIPHGRFLMASLQEGPGRVDGIRAASPSATKELFVVDRDETRPVKATGGIPSLERAVGDRETSRVAAWTDAPGDAAWTAPTRAALLASIDGFHAIPDLPGYEDSWAEWLYFNGRTEDAVFYLSFIFGNEDDQGRRGALVRLQLERGGAMTAYSDVALVDAAALLASAPDVDVGASRVRLGDDGYAVTLDLREEGPDGPRPRAERPGAPRLTAELILDPAGSGSMMPLVLRGARGWVSGYVVPVMAGAWDGRIEAPGGAVVLDGANGFHDHNWGFWKGVTWQWGQVSGDGHAILYGRVRPPAEITDPERLPSFVMVDPPDGPPSFTAAVLIEEEGGGDGEAPASIEVTARGADTDLAIRFAVDDVVRSPVTGAASAADARPLEFLQMKGRYTVSGTFRGTRLEFSAAGAAETYRQPLAR